MILALFIEHYKELIVTNPNNNQDQQLSYNNSIKFLGGCLPELFQKLLDQRPHIRQLANSLLNGIRVAYAPVSILAALSPRIVEVPDKVKTAVMQFLSVIVPHCIEYFNHPQHTIGFLSRISTILCNKPSHTLQQASTKLLELVYNVSPTVICHQIALLPLQQQLVIKKAYLSHVPEIDHLVLLAGKAANKVKKITQISEAIPGPASDHEHVPVSLNSISSMGSGIGIGIVQPSLYDDENDSIHSMRDTMGTSGSSSIGGSSRFETTSSQLTPMDGANSVGGVNISPINSNSNTYTSPDGRGMHNTLPASNYMSMDSNTNNSSSTSSTGVNNSSISGNGAVLGMEGSVDSIHNIYTTNPINPGSNPTNTNTNPTIPTASDRDREVLSPKASMIASISPLVPVNRGNFALIPEMRPITANTSTSNTTTPQQTGQTQNMSVSTNPVSGDSNGTDGVNGSNGTIRDISWFIESLQKSSDTPTKLIAVKEIKLLAKQTTPTMREFWNNNCGQLLSVLLEPFSPEFFKYASSNPNSSSNTPNKGNTNSPSPYAHVTGFTPTATAIENIDNGNVKLNKTQQLHMESMHISCKAISILIKYRGLNVKNFMELLVSRLTHVVAYTPATISYQCEQLLTEALHLDAYRFISIVLPYTISDDKGANEHVRLLALHVLASAIRLLPSSIFLSNNTPNNTVNTLNCGGDSFTINILKHILPSFNSPLVDMRKGVVFILVEIYGVIGDALYPYIIHDMTPPQKKLLAIYIQRYKTTKREAV